MAKIKIVNSLKDTDNINSIKNIFKREKLTKNQDFLLVIERKTKKSIYISFNGKTYSSYNLKKFIFDKENLEDILKI